ncbi:unnamed protein product, partial [Symbiodinium pilosum]
TDALTDANSILRDQPAHAKALYRRAKALVELGRHNEAAEVLRKLPGGDEDVSALLQRALGPPTGPTPARASQSRVPKAEAVETVVPLKPPPEDPSAELRRLLKEAELALKKGDARRALDFSRGASAAAQRAKEEAMAQELPKSDPLFRAPPRPPADGSKEVKQLLTANGLEVRALLALRRFEEARDATRSALKMQSWE